MNVVLVLIDSLNRHYLSAYGDDRVETPALDRFAAHAWRFDNHFVGSLPCMPARREIFAGRKEMLWRPWGPLEAYDEPLPRLLGDGGVRTAIVTDHYHYWEAAGNGYLQSFGGTELIRGHESDHWRQRVPRDAEVPAWVRSMERHRAGDGPRQYYANVRDFADERDFFPAKVMTSAARWLDEERPADQPYYLHVESFDVHEPFHVPEPYASRFWPSGSGDAYTVWPPYQDVAALRRFLAGTTPAELDFIRARYRGKLAMLDRWFGELTDALDRHHAWDDTTVIVTTDHGHDLGERGAFAKQYPHFDTHANIPLLVHHPRHRPDRPDGPDGPGGPGRTLSALTSTVDLHATILDAFGLRPPGGGHSRSLLPLLTGAADRVRDALTYGSFGQGVCCTDGDWTVFKSPTGEPAPLYYYSPSVYRSLQLDTVRTPAGHGFTIPGVELPQWQVPVEVTPLSTTDHLYHRRDDPGQEHNRWSSDAAARDRMVGVLVDLVREEGAPPEQYDRLGLPRP